MRLVLTALACIGGLVLGGCSPSSETIRVKTFVLRDQERDTGIDPWARMEKQALLHGAISMEERSQRLGQYYTVLWNHSSDTKQAVRVLFEYQQGATASMVKSREQTFPAHETSGRASFAVIRDDYRDNGRVLAWQATLFRGDQEIASRRSYLWK